MAALAFLIAGCPARHRAFGAELFVGTAHHAAHVAFMLFIRAKDIEVLDSDGTVENARARRPQVEDVFRKAVWVERTKRFERQVLAHRSFQRAIGRPEEV